MRALVKTAPGPGHLELLEWPEPNPGPGEVKLAVASVGICGTDIHIYKGTWRCDPPVVLGHEWCGTVVEVGAGVTHLRVGDRVTASNPAQTCGNCLYCMAGNPFMCPQRVSAGYMIDGAFADYHCIDARRCHKLPPHVSFRAAALGEPLAVAVRAVTERITVHAGDLVLISGPGCIGLLTLQMAKLEGARVIVARLGRDQMRGACAQRLGADRVVNVDEEDLLQVIADESGGLGVDTVFECAGTPASLAASWQAVRKGGTVAAMGVQSGPIHTDFNNIMMKELNVIGCYGYVWTTWRRTVQLLSQNKINIDEMISHDFPLESYEEAFQTTQSGSGIKVLMSPGCQPAPPRTETRSPLDQSCKSVYFECVSVETINETESPLTCKRMTSQQQDLLRRILLSRYFSNTVILGNMLQFVTEKTANSDRSLKEYEIALEVLRRPDSFDPKLDPVVRVSMKGIRQRLQDYFAAEGKEENLCLTIPKGHYRAQFEPFNPVMEAPALTTLSPAGPALQQFWKPYLGAKSNVLLHTEPLFFRDSGGTYVRNLYANDPATGVHRVAESLGAEPASLQPCFHYLSAGEVHCMFSLLRLFHDLGSSLQIANSRLSSWSETRHSNLILLGCTRTNRFMDDLQQQSGFVITDEEIRNLSSREGVPVSYRGRRYKDGKLQRLTEYALVTRRCGATPQSAVTIIASNHGRAVEGAGYFLSLENEVSKLLARMGFSSSQSLPDRFQILLQVEMIDLDDEVVSVEYLDHRAEPAARTAELAGSAR